MMQILMFRSDFHEINKEIEQLNLNSTTSHVIYNHHPMLTVTCSAYIVF